MWPYYRILKFQVQFKFKFFLIQDQKHGGKGLHLHKTYDMVNHNEDNGKHGQKGKTEEKNEER